MFAADMCKSKSTCTRQGAWKGKKSPCLCLVLVECTWIPRRRVLAQYGQYLWLSVYFVLAEFALANGPASLQASGGVIGLMASRVSRQERPAPFADTGRHSRVPSRFSSTHRPVSVQSLSSPIVCDMPRPSTRAPLIRPLILDGGKKAHDKSRHGCPLRPISPAPGVHSVSTA